MRELGEGNANSTRNNFSVSNFGTELFGNAANDMSRMQSQAQKQKREMFGGNVQVGRGTGLLPPLHMVIRGVLR